MPSPQPTTHNQQPDGGAPPLNYTRVDADLVKTMQPAGRAYYLVLACLAAVVAWGGYAWSVQLRRGLGVAGISWQIGRAHV